MSEVQPRRRAVGAWITYDIANTTFWTGVVGFGFPLWVVKGMKGDDATLGYTLAVTMAIVTILSPVMGALSDQARRRIPLLIATTLICVCATLLLGFPGLMISLGLFALAMGAMELGTVPYNALLTEVSTEGNRGKIAGMGVGIGYLGAFVAVAVAMLSTELLPEPRGYELIFRVSAVLFLLFSLPIFLLLKERPRDVPESNVLDKVSRTFHQLNITLRNHRQFPGLLSFLVVRFFYALGISTATVFAVVYASQTVSLTDREIQLVLLAGISIAIPSGIFWGRMVDRIGPKRVISIGLLSWIGLLLLTVAIAWLSLPSYVWWIVGCFTGVMMAAVFTADRPFLVIFSPPQYLGEFFGLHSTVGKLGRVIGPFMWAFISVEMGLGQPAAVLSLAGCIVIACVILRNLKLPVSSPSTDRRVV